MNGGPRPEPVRRRRQAPADPLGELAARYGLAPSRDSSPATLQDDPLSRLARDRYGIEKEPRATPAPATEPIRMPPAVVTASREPIPNVTAGPVRPVGTSIEDVANLAGRGNITAALAIGSAPREVRERAAPIVRRASAPGKASTLANVALSNTIAPFSDKAAEVATGRALERFAEGGGDVGEIATPAAFLAAAGAVGGHAGLSAVPLTRIPKGASAARKVATRAVEGAAANAAAAGIGAAAIEGAGAEETARRMAVDAAIGLVLGGGFAALPNARQLSQEVREMVLPRDLSAYELRTNVLPKLPEADRRIIERDMGIVREDVPDAARPMPDQTPAVPAETRARGRQMQSGVAGMEVTLRRAADDPLSKIEARHGIGQEPPRAAGTTLGPEAQPGQVNIVRMNVWDIIPDPERFQYKRGGDSDTGAGAELKGLETFDEQLAGVISVWRDPKTGKVHPVNGHNRIALAKRTGHPSVNVQMLPARTAEEARAMGALANIAEGRGTPLDAAEFFRSSGLGVRDLQGRVSLRGATARQGMGLSRMAPDLFAKVQRGDLPESHGAVIGEELPTPELQRAAVNAIEASGKRLSEGEVREVARQVAAAGSERVTQESLFGAEAVEVPLFVEVAQLASIVKRRLSGDRRLFGYVSREGRAEGLARAGNVIDVESSRRIADESAQLEEVFTQLYTRSGPIADALRTAARRVANGENPKTVSESIYPAIRDAVQEALGPGARAGGDASGVGNRGGEPPGEGRAVDSTDPDQNALLTPEDFEPGALRAPREPGTLLSPDRPRGGPPRGAGVTLAPERLEVFAAKTTSGEIVEGRTMSDAGRRAKDAGLEVDMNLQSLVDGTWQFPFGFVTSSGRFVQGREAAIIAFRAGQLRKNTALYRELSDGISPLHVGALYRSDVKGVGGLKGREPKATPPLVAGNIEPQSEVYGQRPSEPPRIVSRAVKYRAEDGTIQVHDADSFWRSEVDPPERVVRRISTGEPYPIIPTEGYRLSDGSFLSRAEARDRFPDLDVGPEGRDPETGEALFDPDPSQESMFGGREGTAASRRLADTEAAARNELQKLRASLPLARDLDTRVKLSGRIAELERLVNRDKAITADELSARAASAASDPPDDLTSPDQGVLLAPSGGAGPRGGRKQTSVPTQAGPTPKARIIAAVSSFIRNPRQALGSKAGNAEEIVNLRKISTGLADAIGVPLYQGRGNLKRMGARGAFWIKPEVVRVNRLGNVQTVMHESLHYLDKKLGMRAVVAATPDPVLRRQVQAELVQMGKDLYGSRRPAGGYASEGVAEFGKFYVTNPAHLHQRAPNAARVLTEILEQHPELKGAFDKSRADFQRLEASPPDAKVQAMIEEAIPSRFDLSPREVVRQMFDDLEPIQHAVDQLGKPGNMVEDAYALARLTKGNAGRSRDMIERGVVAFGSGGQRVTRGLAAILEDVGERDLGPFVRYWVSEQVLTKTGQGVDTGFDVPAARAIVAAGRKRPEYVKAARELWEFRSALLQYLEDAGLPVNAAAIRKNNPTPTPFYRSFAADEVSGGTGKQMARSRAPVYQLKGSDRPILPPLESLVSDSYRMVDIAHRHHAAQTLVKHALQTEGGGKVASLLPEVPMEARRIELARVQQQLVDAGWTPPPNQPPGMGPTPLDALLAFYEKRKPGLSEIQDQVLPISLNGKVRWVQIHDPKLYEALQSMEVHQMGMWERVLSLPTRLLRMGATQRNPDFLLVNPVRDAFQAAIYSRGPSHLPGYHISRGLFHWVRGQTEAGDELYQRWAQEGGESASLVGADRRLIKQAYEKTVADLTAHGARKVGRFVTHPLRTASAMFEAMENATRLGEAAVVREQGLKAGLPEQEATTRGAMAARDVTLDFFKSGKSSRVANRFVAFLTAHLNDMEKLAREFNPLNLADTPEARKRYATITARAVAYVTVPSVALYLLQKDDPVYQEIPEYWKATSWVIVDNQEGPFAFTTASGERIRAWVIPRPHLLGYVFGYAPEKTLEWIQNNDPGALTDLAKQAWTSLLPFSMFVPTLAIPLIENYANKSTFSGRPIVPQAATTLEPAAQAGRRTGETARTVGQLVDYSPAKIENVLRGYTGGLGMLAKDATDVALLRGKQAAGMSPLTPPQANVDDPLESVPVLRRFLVPTPGGDAKSVSRVIRDFEEANAKRRTWLQRRQFNPIAAHQYFTEHEAAIRSVMTAQEGGTLGELRAAYNEILKLKRDTRDIYEGSLDERVRAHELRSNANAQVQAARRHRRVAP